VNVGPENPHKRKKPNLVLLKLQDIKKNDDEKIGKEVRTYRQFPKEDHHRARNKQGKAQQQLSPVIMSAEEEKTDKKSSPKI